jgi:hypothetical protein
MIMQQIMMAKIFDTLMDSGATFHDSTIRISIQGITLKHTQVDNFGTFIDTS